jgi:hypothetical protein
MTLDAGAALTGDHERRAENVMHQEERSIDDQVLAALRSPTLSGMPAVMNPKLISRHIGLVSGSSWGPTPQAVHGRAQEARAGGARRTRWEITDLLDGDSMTPSDPGRMDGRHARACR